MEWQLPKTDIPGAARVPILSWCATVETGALEQAHNLARHPVVEHHVALMPDCHVGYGMPIGGVIGCRAALIPNAVGVDIGCGMGAVQTSLPADRLRELPAIRALLDAVKAEVPVGEGKHHRHAQDWDGFSAYLDGLGGHRPGWWDAQGWELDRQNLGTLGGGNHFLELQAGDDGHLWLMLHSGSRNLGYRIAKHYHDLAQELNERHHDELPARDLAFLHAGDRPGRDYLRDMTLALDYARENRRRMMAVFKAALSAACTDVNFLQEINIHHNYAAAETHFGEELWVHRKGATAARAGELGIIPGSMGTPSYIVRGRGTPESFMSCSHGAGRRLGRQEASRQLAVEDCNAAMTGIVFDRWPQGGRFGRKARRGQYDLGEAPQAYKDIDAVIQAELDLIEPLVRLRPLGVIKG